MATEHQRSLIQRSTTIWRRLSRRERSKSPPSDSETPDLPLRPAPHKLQRRATDSARTSQKRPIITHLQRLDLPASDSSFLSEKLSDFSIESPRSPATRVVASEMQTSPFPRSSRILTVGWDVFLKPEQVYSLFMGFLPERMEDKWFVYSEGPDRSGKLKVHFHRSWTGLKIAELFVVIDLKGEGAGKIVGIKWNGTEQTNGMNEEEAKYMISTTCSWVLGVTLEKGLL